MCCIQMDKLQVPDLFGGTGYIGGQNPAPVVFVLTPSREIDVYHINW